MADIFKGLDLLRQEVPDTLIGKLPRVTCGDCRKNNCQEHQKSKCPVCGGWLGQHTHLDYVGHAETTSKLLEADPAWNWEPLAFTAEGLPAFDADGGLWIKLTVCGVTRLGYGAAENANGFKARGDLRKEVIGDALRNAAMRFGWALNLWAKTDIHERAPQDADDQPQAQVANAVARKAQREQQEPAPEMPDGLLTSVNIALREHGHTTDEARHAEASRLAGRPIASTKELSPGEARHILRALAAQGATPPEGWTDEQRDQLVADLLAALLGAKSEKGLVAIGKQIADAVQAGKVTAADRETLLAGYNDAQAKGRKATAKQPAGVGA